ncbi:hypothetical protein PoB_000146700 [Plakobranchus ocellatus]|uniref:Pectin acetylesterase n=1 Tax=Plakobranchus ocellatus TaxID=259542 RepID=A0AAV3XYN9_9GAST|nr:hypothetical protein PoB_000146700 [Plakobranchus ocellatus]
MCCSKPATKTVDPYAKTKVLVCITTKFLHLFRKQLDISETNQQPKQCSLWIENCLVVGVRAFPSSGFRLLDHQLCDKYTGNMAQTLVSWVTNSKTSKGLFNPCGNGYSSTCKTGGQQVLVTEIARDLGPKDMEATDWSP